MVKIRHLTRQLLFKSGLKIGDCTGSSNHHLVVNLYFMVEGTPVFEKSFPFFKSFDSQSPWSSLRAASSKPTGCRSGILSRRMGASFAWRQRNLLCFFFGGGILFFFLAGNWRNWHPKKKMKEWTNTIMNLCYMPKHARIGGHPLRGRCCPCTPLWMKTLRWGKQNG